MSGSAALFSPFRNEGYFHMAGLVSSRSLRGFFLVFANWSTKCDTFKFDYIHFVFRNMKPWSVKGALNLVVVRNRGLLSQEL